MSDVDDVWELVSESARPRCGRGHGRSQERGGRMCRVNVCRRRRRRRRRRHCRRRCRSAVVAVTVTVAEADGNGCGDSLSSSSFK